jgi:tight adherence protein C
MNDLYIPLISLFTGISVSCTILYFIYTLQLVQIEKQDDEEIKELPLMFKLFMPFTPNFRSISKHNAFDASRGPLNEKIVMAGYENVIDADKFIALKFVITIFAVIIATAIIISGKPVGGVLLLLVMYIYPDVWLKKTIQKRHLSIQRALPNVLDLLTLSVEAGKDFLTSLRDILARRRRDPLGEELERTFHEIQLGKKRVQALKDLVKRVQQPDLSAVMNSIIQSDELGVSIAQLLKIQGDQLRMKRFQRAEKLANEAPVKMIFPIALFIVPAVMIIMGAPLVMQTMKALFK